MLTKNFPPPPEPKRGGKNAQIPPFQKASTQDKRLKLFLWGDSGAGKTTLALQFPWPLVFDLEGGADLYGDSFDFDVMKVTDVDEFIAAVEWLLTNEHQYRTLVIDPITVFWESLQRKWSGIFLQRKKGGKGHKFEFFEMGPREWMIIKAELYAFLRMLIQLDMNVIIIARQKNQYAESGFMRVIGETFDGEKSLSYWFDVIIRQYRDDKGRFIGRCLKDRTNKLPTGEFEISYPVIEKYLGREILTREARPISLATPDQIQLLEQNIAKLGLKPEQVQKRLAAYGADVLAGLTEENAQLIIEKLESAIAAEEAATTKEEKNANDQL